jgi:hypothetical protein
MFNASTYWISVVEMGPFIEKAKEILTDEEREELITLLALRPEVGDIIDGTGGVRKLKWLAKSQGNRTQARVIYYFRDLNMPVYLLAMYSRGETIDLSASGKRLINQLVAQLVAEHGEQLARIVTMQRDGA